jgi:HSP20 family protein
MGKKNEGKDKDKPKIDVALGLGGIFKGLGNFLEMAAELAEKGEKLQTEGGDGMHVRSFGSPKGLQAVYGVSVRVGAGGQPVVERFGNLREKPGKGPVVDDVREPIADLLDENDHFLVVAELPGMEDSAVQWKIRDDILTISGESGDRKYHKEVLLPSPVDEKKVSSSYKNGILELKLWKLSAP